MKRSRTHLFVLFGLVLCTVGPGCAMGYRYRALGATDTNAKSVTGEVEGHEHTASVGVALDFRVVRLVVPLVRSHRSLTFTDDVGGFGSDDGARMTRHYRLDVPLVSFWSPDTGVGASYPGSMKHRESIELWLGGESDLRLEGTSVWGDLSVTYYHYDRVGVRLFGGWGSDPYRVSTQGLDSTHPNAFDGRVQGFGGGIEVTLTAGEYGLDFLQWLLDVEDRQRKVLGD